MVKRNDMSEYMRKTPRLLALEASKKAKQQQTQKDAKVGMSRRILEKKRLEEVEDALRSWKSQQEEGMINHETPISGKAILSSDHQKIPDKKVLEFVIDTLQRKDKNEYFAEPVNGNEVEEYYDVIKNPMDFGTMRAKLHEGFYTTLKQFQDDVYLISENAKTFNAHSTVYYKEACVIGELTERIFLTLKTDPENLVEEFSRKKQYGQKSKYETEGSAEKVDNNTKLKSVARCRSSEPKTSPNFNKAGWRDTYQPPNPKEETYIGSSKHLVLANEDEPRQLGYSDSLRRFVKDMGPAAQKVANEKQMLLNQMQIRSLLVPYESQENVSYNNNVTTDPNAQLVIHSSDRRLKEKMVLGSESSNTNKDETSFFRLLAADSPTFVGPKSSVYPSTIVRESGFGLSGNMFQPSSKFSQMPQQPMNPVGTNTAYVQPKIVLGSQNAYVQSQNMLGEQNTFFQQQNTPGSQIDYFQQQKMLGPHHAYFQQLKSLNVTENANSQQQNPPITQNANLQQQKSLGTQMAYLQQPNMLCTVKEYLQQQNPLGAESAIIQPKNPLGIQTSFSQLQNPSGAQTSFLEMLNPMGTQNSFSLPQNPSGAQTSFSQMMNPWDTQNSYFQQLRNRIEGKQPDNVNQSQDVDPRLRMINPKN